jgi:hypothetical protein
VAKPGIAFGLGPKGRRFKSGRPDFAGFEFEFSAEVTITAQERPCRLLD